MACNVTVMFWSSNAPGVAVGCGVAVGGTGGGSGLGRDVSSDEQAVCHVPFRRSRWLQTRWVYVLSDVSPVTV